MNSGAFVIIEALNFTSVVKDYFGNDTTYAAFQNDLIASPDKGNVVPGAAPIRKIRWGDKRRDSGKRGGLRIIYIHIPDIHVLFLVDVYGKDEAEDLTPQEKKLWRDTGRRLVDELRKRHQRGML